MEAVPQQEQVVATALHQAVDEDQGLQDTRPALRVVVSRDIFRRRVTMGEYVAITEGNIRVANEVMARFLVDQEGHAIPEDKAASALLALSLEEYDVIAEQFRTGMERAAVPLGNGTT